MFDRPNRYPGTVISLIKHRDGDEDAVYYDKSLSWYYIKKVNYYTFKKLLQYN